MNLEELFNQVSERMKSDFRKAQMALQNPGQKGESNEKIFKEFLRQYLPMTLDVITGTLVDSDGKQSKQLDVILSDAVKTPIFYQSGNVRVIPVECAYAVFEVKAYLDKAELEKSFENMKSVKELKKEAYFHAKGAVQYTRTLYGKLWDHWPTNHFVFAFDSTGLNSILDNLVELQKDMEIHKRIDAICILEKGLIINMQPDGMLSALPTEGSTIIPISTSKTLLLFYMMISVILNQATMDPLNILPYMKGIRFVP